MNEVLRLAAEGKLRVVYEAFSLEDAPVALARLKADTLKAPRRSRCLTPGAPEFQSGRTCNPSAGSSVFRLRFLPDSRTIVSRIESDQPQTCLAPCLDFFLPAWPG